MKKRLKIIAWGILLAGVAVSQNRRPTDRLDIDENGAVSNSKHVHWHTNHNRSLTWGRKDPASSWQIQFTSKSPCQEGSSFSSAGPTTCTIAVTSGAYPYTSSKGSGAPQFDPDVIVDN